MSCEAIRANKKTHLVRSYIFPASYDFTGFAPEMRIAASEGSTALLTVNLTATPNGSYAQCSGRVITFTITPADLQTLPDGDPVSDPWIGMAEVDVTSPVSIISLLQKSAFILSKGV